jgi:hypothetical protein
MYLYIQVVKKKKKKNWAGVRVPRELELAEKMKREKPKAKKVKN